MTENSLLFDVRCPFQKPLSGSNKLYTCNRLCVKVHAGSSGQARCRSCHKEFLFEVDDQAKMSTGVRVKKAEESAAEREQRWT